MNTSLNLCTSKSPIYNTNNSQSELSGNKKDNYKLQSDSCFTHSNCADPKGSAFRMCEGINLVITPINKNPKSPSNVDYVEQVSRVGYKWCWDDSCYNTANAGEYFAFCFNDEKVVIHRISEVKSPTERLPSWSKNVGHRNRNVLELSDPLLTIPWSKWQEMGGHKKIQGTCRTELSIKKRPMLFEHISRAQSPSAPISVAYP